MAMPGRCRDCTCEAMAKPTPEPAPTSVSITPKLAECLDDASQRCWGVEVVRGVRLFRCYDYRDRKLLLSRLLLFRGRLFRHRRRLFCCLLLSDCLLCWSALVWSSLFRRGLLRCSLRGVLQNRATRRARSWVRSLCRCRPQQAVRRGAWQQRSQGRTRGGSRAHCCPCA